jgi:hypothetical protein
MNREMFVKVATTVLRQMGDQQATEKAEALATQMDVFAAVLGDSPMPTARPLESTKVAFPGVNPDAVMPAPPLPQAPTPTLQGDQTQDQPLVTLATTIPANIERVDQRAVRSAAPSSPPVRSLRGQGKMKVEELSRLIQEQSPTEIQFPVQTETGVCNITYVRNVISMHAYDSVKLVYSPANATASAREAVEVEKDIHIEDIPIDMPAIVKKLIEDAAIMLRPRRPVVAAEPAHTSGPVKHADDTYQDPGLANIQQVFNSIG